MQVLKRLVLTALLLTAQSAHADVIYNYVGKPFTTIVDHEIPSGAYETSMFVTASLTFANSLPANMPFAYNNGPAPLAYLVSDGRQTFNGSTSDQQLLLTFTTDATSNILQWIVIAQNVFTGWKYGDKSFEVSSVNTDQPEFGFHSADQGFQQYCLDFAEICGLNTYDQGYNQSWDRTASTSGTWTVSTISAMQVPEPPITPMLIAGLLGLVILRVRRNEGLHSRR